MNETSHTRASLLIQLRDPENNQAWSDFVDIYVPLVHAYLRKRGVQDADAADLTQEVLQIVARRAGDFSYDRSRGSFRGWLLTVTLNKLRDFSERQKRQAKGSGKTEVIELLNELPDEDVDSLWNQQHQWHLFRWAAERARTGFRETSWRAFWKTAIHQESASDVAAELGISVGAVHVAKSRGLARIRELIRDVEHE